MEQSRRELLKFASIAGACSVLPANLFAADSNASSGAKPWQERISRSVVENASKRRRRSRQRWPTGHA